MVMSEAQERARVIAALMALGSVISLLALILPGWPERDQTGLLILALLAAVPVAPLWFYAGRVPLWLCHLIVLVGNGLISASVALGGGGAASATRAMFYVWIVILSFLYFRLAPAIAHLVFAVCGMTAALAILGDLEQAAPQLLIVFGTAAPTGVIIRMLVLRVRALAGTDELTGLANRRSLDVTLTREMARAARSNGPLCLALLDLDGFKAFNDAHGHAAGDALLKEVTASWSGQLRRGDLLARLGGDEFAAVLADTDLGEAKEVIERLVSATPGPVSCSAGLTLWDHDEPYHAMLERADAALYQAKTNKVRRTVVRLGHSRSTGAPPTKGDRNGPPHGSTLFDGYAG